MSGIQAAREIRKAGVNSKIVFLTAHADADYVTSAFESGAAGYVLKLRMNTDLVVAVREVLSGRVFSSPNGVPHKAFKTSKQPARSARSRVRDLGVTPSESHSLNYEYEEFFFRGHSRLPF